MDLNAANVTLNMHSVAAPPHSSCLRSDVQFGDPKSNTTVAHRGESLQLGGEEGPWSRVTCWSHTSSGDVADGDIIHQTCVAQAGKLHWQLGVFPSSEDSLKDLHLRQISAAKRVECFSSACTQTGLLCSFLGYQNFRELMWFAVKIFVTFCSRSFSRRSWPFFVRSVHFMFNTLK